MEGLHDFKLKDWERLLKDSGFSLDRIGKHRVWKHSDGRTIPVSSQGVNACIARRTIKENNLVFKKKQQKSRKETPQNVAKKNN